MTESNPKPMTRTLNAKSALMVVMLYLITSIIAGVFASIFFGGIGSSSSDRLIDGVIGSGMIANLMVMALLLYISIKVFKQSRKDIFFERMPFSLSRRYYLFPLIWLGVSIFALFWVDYTSYSLIEIMLVLVATLAIGANEEIVTRGILLVGLRNSGVTEWIAWLLTMVVFSLLHLLNVLGGANLTILFIVLTGGTLLYVSRRVFGNLLIPIGLHAFYDTAFFLLTGKYAAGANLPDPVLDIQLGSFLVLMLASILFLIFGWRLFRQESTGWLSKRRSAVQDE